jgi:hypothetical protein
LIARVTVCACGAVDVCAFNDNLCLTMGKRMIALINSIVIGIAQD